MVLCFANFAADMFFRREQGKPFIIAGPCSAESFEQLSETAKSLSQLPVDLFRAGVWKPRTRPGSFEGRGLEALKWLQDIKKQYGLSIAIEVAEPQHIELALQYDIDVLWIGARTTVNPFQVQRLADALMGVAIPVMIKNPVNPDVDLWQGAIERIEGAGIKDIAAIHRGFSGYDTASKYRNQPNWPIPIELKRRNPGLPIITDPSHIGGKRELIAPLAQKAMDMGFEGLMIEAHPDPAHAMTDANQQITPAALAEILQNLNVRVQHPADVNMSTSLEYLRQIMDTLDAEIIDLLARRMELSEKMGIVKRDSNITTYQPDRWRDIIETRSERAVQLNLSKAFVISLYQLIHDESIRKQLEILQDRDANNNVKH